MAGYNGGRGGSGSSGRSGGRPGGQRRSQAGAQRRGEGRERGRGNEEGRNNRARRGQRDGVEEPRGSRREQHGGQPRVRRREQRGGRRGDRRRTDRDQRPRRSDTRVDEARLVALEVLTKVREDGAFANLVLPPLLDEARLGRRDSGFATALTYGTLRLQGRYDAILARCVDRPLDRLDPVVLDCLRLGAHQLLGMRVATHGAVSATVDLASYTASRGASGLVNAVLRKVADRDLDAWLAEIAADAPDELEALARTQSHPRWIVKALRQSLIANGRDAGELEALLAADNADPEVVLCARPGLISPEHLAKETVEAAHAEPRPGETSPYALVLPGSDPGRIEAVRSSRAGVEDEGSQLVALMLADAPLEGRDDRWLDLCAGPGGKAALLAARAAQRGARLTANEVTPHRAHLVEAAVRAVPDGVVEVRCGDGREYGEREPKSYDRVLVDAPCSGLGSLRRRPEARWRRDPKDVTELAGLQRELLTSALSAVRRGGVVAYVTCSPHVLETELVVRDVMKALNKERESVELLHTGDVATRVAPVPPAGADRDTLQLWPHTEGTDAMYCALIRRLH